MLSKYQMRCDTCQRTKNQDSPCLPEGWKLECDRCSAATPAKQKKTVRHCFMCREPVIVVHVPGQVRLICGKCATKDRYTINLEKVMRERDKVQTKLTDALQANAEMTRDLGRMREDIEDRAEVRAHEILKEREDQAREDQERSETALAERIRTKLQAKYGEENGLE